MTPGYHEGMTDLTRIPVPNEGPITDKVKEIYERSFPPEEQIPLPELLRSAEAPEVSFVAWADPALPTDEARATHVVALTYSFAFHDLFYLGFLAVDGRTRSTGYGSRILTYFAKRYASVPQLLEIEPMTREAANYQQRVRRLAFYERNGFTVTNMITHEADQTYRVLTRNGIVTPQRLEEALNSVTEDPAYASRVTTD